MKKINLALVAVLLFSGWVQAQFLETKFQALIDSVYGANPSSGGIMVHVEAPDRSISWSGASGISDREAQTPLAPDQPALIASNIKTYVSAAILRLVEEKKLGIDQPIEKLLTKRTRKLFEGGGYDPGSIEIRHLLSHTSGIRNYANQEYIDFINNNKTYRWTRDEQLERTIDLGKPLGEAGTTFNYTDANYLLLTEIMENITGEPFYTSMRELLRYEELGINNTWFPTLEEVPEGTKPLVHQYWGAMDWDSHDIDVSVDLYGGGGIACPTKDLARFNWLLFNAAVIRDTAVLNLVFTEIPTNDSLPSHYLFGLWPYEFRGLKAYGHSGFWGTIALWFPDMNTSVSLYVLDRDQLALRPELLGRIVGILARDMPGK